MAQTERLAKSLTWTGSATQAAEITSLRTAISIGKTIYANDLNRIATLVNNMNGHYHTYDDARQLATYGAGYGDNPGAGDRTNYYVTSNTTSIDAKVAVTATSSVDTVITNTMHDALRISVNELRSHYHGITDTTA